MSVEHKHITFKSVQTLSHARTVYGLDMRLSDDRTTVTLITGYNGDIQIYQSPRSHTQRLNFTLQCRFTADANASVLVSDLRIHPRKPLFITASRDDMLYPSRYDVKVWEFKDIAAPHLIKTIPHPSHVFNAMYSNSGLIATGCHDCQLRVYGKEPLLSLRWSFMVSGAIWSLAWSPSNRLAASFTSGNSYAVQVWDSSFQTLFTLQQEEVLNGQQGLVFASNDLLMSSGGRSNSVYWYHMSKPKVMSVFVEKDMLPFCRDVMKIIITYLPFDTHITHHTHPDYVGTVTALNSRLMLSSCYDGMLRVWKVHGIYSPVILASLPHHYNIHNKASCMTLSTGEETVFALASMYGNIVYISAITVPQVWILITVVCLLFR